MKFRKRPIVIEAIQYNGKNHQEIFLFMNVQCGRHIEWETNNFIEIETLEGVMIADKKDWIIKGINGEFYPCKPDIFEKTYEVVE